MYNYVHCQILHKSYLNIWLFCIWNKFYTFRFEIQSKSKLLADEETTACQMLQLILKSCVINCCKNLNNLRGLYLHWKGRTTGIKLHFILFQQKTLHPGRSSELDSWPPNTVDMFLCNSLLMCWTLWGRDQTFKNWGGFMASHPSFGIYWSTQKHECSCHSSGLQEEWQRRSPDTPQKNSEGFYLPVLEDNFLLH